METHKNGDIVSEDIVDEQKTSDMLIDCRSLSQRTLRDGVTQDDMYLSEALEIMA